MSRCRTGAPIIFTSCGAAVLMVALVLGVASGAARSTQVAADLEPRATAAAFEPSGRATLRLEKARKVAL